MNSVCVCVTRKSEKEFYPKFVKLKLHEAQNSRTVVIHLTCPSGAVSTGGFSGGGEDATRGTLTTCHCPVARHRARQHFAAVGEASALSTAGKKEPLASSLLLSFCFCCSDVAAHHLQTLKKLERCDKRRERMKSQQVELVTTVGARQQ